MVREATLGSKLHVSKHQPEDFLSDEPPRQRPKADSLQVDDAELFPKRLEHIENVLSDREQQLNIDKMQN